MNKQSTRLAIIAVLSLVVILFCLFRPGSAPVAGSTQTARVETVVVVQIITATFPPNTATPEFTPTITDTPGPPTATVDVSALATKQAEAKLKGERGDGFYLVNVDIAPGVWRNDGSAADCYWSVNTATGDIINNHFGQAGGTAFIPVDAFQVQFKGCGSWTWLQ